jgi:hypothetical protein
MLIRSAPTFVRYVSAAAIGAAAVLLCHTPAAAAPMVWSGYTYEFVRPDFADPYPSDKITPKVHFIRGNDQGLYNAILDTGWTGSGPSGTRWATDINNAGKTIAASNWQALQFGTWLAAYRGLGSLGFEIENRNAVVHLVEEDIYLDLRFTDWTQRNGGGFSYLRAEAPAVPEPTTLLLLVVGWISCSVRRSLNCDKR